MMSLGDAACKLGLPVFPCNRHKRPVTDNGHNAATRDEAEIIMLFQRSGAERIGVPTGRHSGLIVIDVDVKNGRNGMVWLEANRKQLPETRTHRTQSGGLHLVFKIPGSHIEISNSVDMIAPGIDVRGQGGYAIWPPSPGYTIVDDLPPVEMPIWLQQACLKPPPPPDPPPQVMALGSEGRQYLMAALEYETRSVRNAPEGTRNNTLNIAAVRLGNYVGGGYLPRSLVEDWLTDAAREAGLDPVEIRKTLKSGLDKGEQHPRKPPERSYNSKSTSSEARDYWQTRAEETKSESGPEDPSFDWWLERDIPPACPLLGWPIIAESKLILAGPTGAGKTQLAMAMAASLALGRSFLHWKGPPAPVSVLYLECEMSARTMQRRILALAKRLRVRSIPNFRIVSWADYPDWAPFNTQKGARFLADKIEQFKPTVTFIDNRIFAIQGVAKDEESWATFRPAMQAMIKAGSALVLIDHVGQDVTKPYGTRLPGFNADSVAILEDSPDKPPGVLIAFQLTFTKARERGDDNAADFATVNIRLENDQWVSEPVDPVALTAKKRGVGRPMKDDTEALRREIVNLAVSLDLTPQVILEGMPPVRAIPRNQLYSHLIACGWLVEGEDYPYGKMEPISKRGRNRVSNCLTTLKVKGFCGFDKTFVWPIL